MVFNLDSSVSNDDLRQIFGVYGEIKEVISISDPYANLHQSFIEMRFKLILSFVCRSAKLHTSVIINS